jgi:hypothetical protein
MSKLSNRKFTTYNLQFWKIIGLLLCIYTWHLKSSVNTKPLLWRALCDQETWTIILSTFNTADLTYTRHLPRHTNHCRWLLSFLWLPPPPCLLSFNCSWSVSLTNNTSLASKTRSSSKVPLYILKLWYLYSQSIFLMSMPGTRRRPRPCTRRTWWPGTSRQHWAHA